MIRAYVELSGEAPALAAAELATVVDRLGGAVLTPPAETVTGASAITLPDRAAVRTLAEHLALAHRAMVPVAPEEELEAAAFSAGRAGGRAAFRQLGRGSAPADSNVRRAGAAYVRGGGVIDLAHSQRRFWLAEREEETPVLLEELAEVPRAAFAARAMPRLPFRRPVSLAPRLARAAVNLAGVGPGDRVLDPFLGTGALLAEAALLGARVYGLDRDPAMVRGALANFRHLGVTAAALAQGDARHEEVGPRALSFDAIVTDPPYGRSSAVGGEEPGTVARSVLARWQGRLRRGGRVVVVAPGGPPSLEPPWVEELNVPVRVHRSLTRQFRRYVRSGDP